MACSWQVLRDSLRDGDPERYFSRDELQRFREFVDSVPPKGRVPMLLDAYRAYRTEQGLEKSIASVLISVLLKARLKPTEGQVCEMLRLAFHHCGHGGDVAPPIDFIEKAFQGKPLTQALFDAVRAYRAALQGLTSSQAQEGKRKLNWFTWLDVSRPDAKCYTAPIQRACAAMGEDEAFAWQWLLRNAAPGYKVGKAWFVEAEKRLARVGREKFLARVDEWFRVPEGKVALSPGGSQMLRLMVFHGKMFPHEAVIPVFGRLLRVEWKDTQPVQKVMGALAVLLMNYRHEYPEISEELCRRFASESADVARLQEVADPGGVVAREVRQAELQKGIDAIRQLAGDGRSGFQTMMLEVLEGLQARMPKVPGRG